MAKTVKAVKQGFHGSLRQPGDVFEVPDDLKGSWFTVVPEGVKGGKPLKGEKKEGQPLTLKDAAELV